MSTSANRKTPPAPESTARGVVDAIGGTEARRRVVFVSQASTFGGHEAMAVRAAAALSKEAGHRVVFRIWSRNARLLEAIGRRNAAGARIVVETADVVDRRLNAMRSPFRRAEIAEEADRFARDRDAVWLLVQGHVESGSIALLAARRAQVPLASYLPMAHPMRSTGAALGSLRDRLNRLYYALPSAYVTIGRSARADLAKAAPGKPVLVVENGIEPPAPTEASLALPELRPDRRWVAIVGRVDFHQKGHDRLVAAMTLDRAAEAALGLLVVGDGPDLPALRQRVRDAGLQDRVLFVPWVDGSMEAVYRAVDAVILPSNYEGVPLVMLEALARRLPVAGSARDGMLEWLPNEALFDNRDPAAIVAALRFALSGHAATLFEPAYARAREMTREPRFAADWRRAIDTLAAMPRG